MNEENLVIRLKRFMKIEGISSTQLADAANIPRPSLSQILSGRNKKISDQIITMLHRAYPALSINWLMFGEGPMKIAEVDDPLESSVFDDSLEDGQMFQEFSNVNDLSAPVVNAYTAKNQHSNVKNTASSPALDGGRNSVKQRKIVSITVFFDDNSFETFAPGKK